MKLCSEASDSVMELEAFVEKMMILKKKSVTDQADGTLSPSENERLVTVQEQMKDIMSIQKHHQQEFMMWRNEIKINRLNLQLNFLNWI
ncbi:hypothetical protein DPMN_064872 [Dreissena polymorpha]|uniref:Uncharacterized protein n=1 Tax=Dreissena polymorpha TaxID=45954 RepID=A0A9D4HLI4_DREPO|nr:hypothetical protein DPMN_064872 [Dreissena polymorpha]